MDKKEKRDSSRIRKHMNNEDVIKDNIDIRKTENRKKRRKNKELLKDYIDSFNK